MPVGSVLSFVNTGIHCSISEYLVGLPHFTYQYKKQNSIFLWVEKCMIAKNDSSVECGSACQKKKSTLWGVCHGGGVYV